MLHGINSGKIPWPEPLGLPVRLIVGGTTTTENLATAKVRVTEC